jgi:hypothetical protein
MNLTSLTRTNVYLDDDELRKLEHIAVEEGLSFTELVRRALSVFADAYRREGLPPEITGWGQLGFSTSGIPRKTRKDAARLRMAGSILPLLGIASRALTDSTRPLCAIGFHA